MTLVMTGIQSVTSGVLVATWLVSNDLILQSHSEDLLPKTTAIISLDWISPDIVPETRIQVQMVYLETLGNT